MPGKLVILSGPSGVGKDTLIDAWKARNPLVQRVVAATTRDRAENESDGIDYHFLSLEEFVKRTQAGFFLEWKEVHGKFYGTPIEEVDELLAAGKIAILKIDVQGAIAVMELRRDATTIFVMPPSVEELEHRIRSRKRDTPEQIEKRLETAKREMALRHAYQHVVVNDELEATVDQLEQIVSS